MKHDHQFTGMYRGKVLATDAAETDKLGRIKAEVYPMLIGKETARQLRKENTNVTIEGIATTDLPWAVSAPPLFGGAGVGFGTFAIPEVGTYVWLFFEAGDINQPVYFAEAPSSVSGLPAERLTNYPNRRVIKTTSGCMITIDDVTGKVIITGSGDVIIQGTNVRINPLSPIT